jgi:hypothetical protein
MRFNVKVLLAVAAAAAVAVSASSSASAGTGCDGNGGVGKSLRACIVGTAVAAGDYATTVASGTVTKPGSVTVVVYTSKAQPVDIAWTMVCSRGMGAGSKSGHATRTAMNQGDGMGGPTHRGKIWTMQTMRPLPMANADSCDVSADAQLSASGSLRVDIVGIQR